MDTMVIGIAGGTGSGKTTLSRMIKARLGGDGGKGVRPPLPAPKKKDTTAVVSFFLGFRGKLKCSGEVNSPSAKVLPPAKRLYGAGAPPALWAGKVDGKRAAAPKACR